MTEQSEKNAQQNNDDDEKARIAEEAAETLKRIKELNIHTESAAASADFASISPSEMSSVLREMNEMLNLFKDTGFGQIVKSLSPDTSSVVVHSNDKPNKFAHLGFRSLYTLIAWLAIGKVVFQGQGFFVSVFLFIIPLFMDYLKFDTPDRRWLRRTGITTSVIWIIFSFSGLINILAVSSSKIGLVVMVAKDYIAFRGVSVPIEFIWLLMLTSVALTTFDWFFYEPSSNPFKAGGGKNE